MRTIRIARPLVALVMVLLFGVLTANLALAHERRDVGKYQFVVGFAVEPAFEGVPNGASLRVTNRETNTPVTGLENTIQVEIHHGSTQAIKNLRAVFGQPGLYQADLIPTAPGTYEFHFKGTVEGLDVEEEFVSGPGRFNDVQPQADTQFPESVGSVREVQAAARGASTAANDALDKASSASTLAIVGVALGAIGIVIGGAGVALAARRKGKS